MTFYDNHDVQRLDADDNGFIDANNFLFTVRGIPQVYYGSEMGFERGMKEHQGSRNYYGEDNIAKAKSHPIYQALTKVAQLRKSTPALQRGVQINIDFSDNKAAFLRILDLDGTQQTALVLLNKGDIAENFAIEKLISNGVWQARIQAQTYSVTDNKINVSVPAHGLEVLLFEGANNNVELLEQLVKLSSATTVSEDQQ